MDYLHLVQMWEILKGISHNISKHVSYGIIYPMFFWEIHNVKESKLLLFHVTFHSMVCILMSEHKV